MDKEQHTVTAQVRIDEHARSVELNPRSGEARLSCHICGSPQSIELLRAHEQQCPAIKASDDE